MYHVVPRHNKLHKTRYCLVGGMSYDAYQKQQKSRGLKPAPLPKVSEEEKAAKKLERWKKTLRGLTGRNSLTRNADKYPKLTWLSATWCLKGSDSKIPANYYKVTQNGIGGMQIIYSDDSHTLFYNRLEISAINSNHFSLFLASWSKDRKHKERGRRLKKISDEEFALTLIYKVYPEKDIKSTEVYVKCE